MVVAYSSSIPGPYSHLGVIMKGKADSSRKAEDPQAEFSVLRDVQVMQDRHTASHQQVKSFLLTSSGHPISFTSYYAKNSLH